MARILLITNEDWGHYIHRLPLARALRADGHEVIFVSPFTRWAKLLQEEGFRCVDWHLDRRSLNPLKELLSLWQLWRIYRRERPSVVQHFTIKPIIYGSLAALMSFRPCVINTFTGVSFPFLNAGPSIRFRPVLTPLLRLLLGDRRTRTIFHNPEDEALLIRQRIVSTTRSTVILGGGVDTSRFAPSKRPNRKRPVVLIMVSRLLTDKGVAEYAEAARILREEGSKAEFWHVGGEDPGSLVSVLPQDLVRYSRWVDFKGHREDVAELLNDADIAVLPSHHEGMPRFLLEAASSGLPIIASAVGGCQYIVRDGENGYLTPVSDPLQLAQRIRSLVDDPSLRQEMGAKSREIAVSEFSEGHITEQYLQIYRQALG